MRGRFFGALAAIALMAGSAPASIFTENFESLVDGDLNGQGSWTASTSIDLVSPGFLPSRVLAGILASGASTLHFASHGVNLVGESGPIVLSFDAYGLVADVSDGVFSHNSGAGLGFSGTSLDVGWIAMNGGGWRFVAEGLTGNLGDFDDILGGMETLAQFEVVLDRSAGEVFGRWSFGFGWNETAHFAASSATMDLLTSLSIQQDYSSQTLWTGVDVDNFNLSAAPASVPEPFTMALGAAGAGLAIRRIRRRAA